MVLTSSEVPSGFLPPPALDYTARFGGSVHRALSEIRGGRARIPSAAFASAAFAAAGEAAGRPAEPYLLKSSSECSIASSTGSNASSRSLSSGFEPNVEVKCEVPASGGFQTAFAYV